MLKTIKTMYLLLFFPVLFLLVPGRVYAVTPPTFPSCLNPQGTLVVSYNDGQHGIPGDFSTYTGSDQVYSLSDETLIQCFCSINGNGIQTNWWKVSFLDEEGIEVLKSQGWNYVPTGAVWGLTDDPYVAQNLSYACGVSNNGTSNGSSSSGDGGSSSSESSTSTPSVLGLAFTGNIILISSILTTGIALLLGGIFLAKRK